MDFEALAGLGWREGLIAIIALLALYVVVAFLRIRRLKRDALPLAVDRFAAQSATAAYAAMQEPELSEGFAEASRSARDEVLDFVQLLRGHGLLGADFEVTS